MGVETTGAGVDGGVAAGGVLPKPAPALVVVVVLPEPAAGALDALVVPAACVVVLPATGVALPELTVVAVALALLVLVLAVALVVALALASLEFVLLEEVEALEPSPPHPASASKVAARNQCGRLSVWRNVMMSLVNRCVIDARNPCLRETRYYRRRTRQTCLKRATFGPVQVAKVMEILRSPSRSAVKRR